MNLTARAAARIALACGLAAVPTLALAVFPAPYQPTAVQPAGTPQRHEFDLTAAAQREHILAARRGVPSVAPLAARPGPRVVQARRVVPHRV